MTLKNGEIFSKIPPTYDPFEKDIAVVKIIYQKATVIKIGSKAKMTWIDYFSNVGKFNKLSTYGPGVYSINLFSIRRSRPLFRYFRLFIAFERKQTFNLNFANDWI